MPTRIKICGTAQAPTTEPWIQNIDSTRSTDEALSLSDEKGVVFPEEVKLVPNDQLPTDVYAAYLLPADVYEHEVWHWKRFLNRFGEILIRVKPTVLASDEAIVAVLAHEAFELNGLRDLISDSYSFLKSPQLYHLIAPGINGNLHCRAWDDSDERIRTWRAERST